jgi:hypothetical protein
MKNCTKCRENLELKCFNKDKRAKDGLHSSCRKCHDLCVRNWQSKNQDKIKDTTLKRKYGISLVDYNKMLELQNNSCYVCKIKQKDFKKMLYVDHCHTTGDVRKLLCETCNLTLGKVKENIEILQNLIDYIKEHKK